MISFRPEDIFLVTGASSGLGEATALLLNSLGATVIAVSRDKKRLAEVHEQAKQSENFHVESFDFKQTDEIAVFIKGLVKKHGKLSGVAHFAGMSMLFPLRATSLEVIKEIFELNFFSSYEILKSMGDKRLRAPDGCSLLLVSSISSLRSFEGLSAYGASKGAIDALVRSSAVELSKSNIRINSIVPGHIETQMTRQLAELQSEEYKQEIIDSYPLGVGEPDDVANLSVFLLSPASRWVTGQNIVIDGGRTLI